MGLDQNPVFRTVVNIALNKQKVKKAELLYHPPPFLLLSLTFCYLRYIQCYDDFI